MSADIKKTIERSISKKGPLRMPSYWMRRILEDIVDKIQSVKTDIESRLKLFFTVIRNINTQLQTINTQLNTEKSNSLHCYVSNDSSGEYYLSADSVYMGSNNKTEVVVNSVSGVTSGREGRLIFTGATSLTLPDNVLWRDGIVPTIDASAVYVLRVMRVTTNGDTDNAYYGATYIADLFAYYPVINESQQSTSEEE